MTQDDFLNRLKAINIWKSGGARAPHKPLLILLALGRLQSGDPRLVSFVEIEKQLNRLLSQFGPPRKTQHPEDPFGRLVNDDLWEVPEFETLAKSKGGSLLKSALKAKGAEGGLRESDYRDLLSNPDLLQTATQQLLDAHFPESFHEDIMLAVGISKQWQLRDAPERPKRDPKFRDDVLRAYEYRCAVCDYDIRVGNDLLGLEAAHIKWHAAGGPDVVMNGLALCGFHHKAFDRGAWGLAREARRYRILISSEVHGQSSAVDWLKNYHRKDLREPQQSDHAPTEEYVHWHSKQVFRGPVRGDFP